jgi:Domain of Unknown Function (DUF748)
MANGKGWAARAANLTRSRRVLMIVLIIVGAVAIFTLAGFFGVPLLLGHLARVQVAAALHRQVSVGEIRFNPYTLRLSIDRLHVAERDSQEAFADIGQIRLKASWSSAYRFAPIVQELVIDRPTIHIVRTPAETFNFSDLIAPSPAPPASPAKPPGKPFHFALSNIQLNDGQVLFDDQALHAHHSADHIRIDIPFIANLPADVQIFVQPLVKMSIDGSPFRLVGMARPFAAIPESTLDLRLRRLDLPRYAAYLGHKVPIRIPQGTLLSDVQVHFIQPESGPVVRLSGTMEVDSLDVRDASSAPLVGFKRLSVALTDVEPLRKIITLGAIQLDGLTSNFVLNRGGTNNFTSLTASSGGAQARPAATAQPQSAPPYMFVQSMDLSNGSLKVTDNSAATPVVITLDGIHAGFKNFDTNKQAAPIPFQAGTRIGAGTATVKGSFDLAHSRVMADAALDKIDLPPLQALAQPFWAGTLASGKLSVKATLQSDFAPGHFNVHVQPATASLDTLEVRAPTDAQKPIACKSISVALDQVDLAARQAAVKELKVDGLTVSVKRAHDGQLSLLAFVHAPPSGAPRPSTDPPSAAPPAKPPPQTQVRPNQPVTTLPAPSSQPPPPATAGAHAQAWQYRIESVAIENTDADVEDESAPQPIAVHVAPLNVHVKDVSNDFSKPLGVAVEGTLKPRGGFKVDGTVVPTPLEAKLRVATTRIDLSPANTYVSSMLNARITSVNLTMNGAVEVATAKKLRATYRGDATLGNLRMLDKVTNERFLRWNALTARGINAEIAGGPPRVHVSEVALSDFYARVILNSDAKLNLSDLVAKPKAAPTSITHAKPAAGDPPAPPSQAPAKGHSIDADIRLGRITLQGGHVNYTDNFIKPNYTADLTEIAGKIGGFGTRSTQPAEVELQGQINSSAPINITGSLNPLAPKAFVDIKAKADGVELSNLSPYSTKYTGYPITKGTLTVDVHYLLQNNQLTASNHIFIDQLTFGDKVPSPNAINLPIALAVSLLKNPQGAIDLTIPVSGSLSDPQFSIGAVILQAFTNLIMKAITAPFALLASAIGSSGQNLEYVEFPAGLATLTPDSIKKLATLSKALKDRPSLKLTISGRVDPKFDTDGLRAAMVDRSVKAQRAKELRASGDIVDVQSVTIASDEYDKYLTMAYKNAKFPKPTNALGLTKSLPPDEMKKLMLTNTKVTDADLKDLANARALEVRSYLSKQVDPVRLAVVAPKLNADGIKDKGKTTRVDLSIK